MVKSAKGVEVNMNELSAKFDQTVAVGNVHMNARGDLLGKGGKIVKSREERAQEYHDIVTGKQIGRAHV